MSQVYMVTGATRGLGRGFVTAFLAHPGVTAVAAVRNPFDTEAKALEELPKGTGSKLLVVKLNSASPTDATDTVHAIEGAGIDHLDTVVANTGISDNYSLVNQVPVAEFTKHMDINGLGPLHLIQAAHSLLSKSSNPRFAGVTSLMASIGGMEQRAAVPSGGYGPSKAVLNYLVRKLHFENESFTSFVMEPGFVNTDMGSGAARFFGMPTPDLTIEKSVAGMAFIIDTSTCEETSGRYMMWNGDEVPW